MKKIFSLFLVFFMGVSYSQQATATWHLTNPANGGTGLGVVTEGQIVGYDELLSNTEINQYSGPNSSQRIRILGNSWPADLTDQIDTVYVQFEVSPKESYNLQVDSISMKLAAASSSTFKANIYYSKDPDFTSSIKIEYNTLIDNNYLPRDSLFPVTASSDITLEEGEKLYVRVYPWNEDAAIKTGKYLCLQDVTVYGTAEAIPVSASVTWPLNADEDPVISGLISAGPETFGNNLYLYDFSLVAGTGTNAARITTVSHDWQAETAPDLTRYVQYAASPMVGGTFYVNSISFKLGANFTNNLRASVYYSKDSTFTEKTILIPDTSLVSSDLTAFSFDVNDTVETGENIYVRIYPFNRNAEGWAKLMYVSDVKISGSTTGLAILLPTITTTQPSYVSTTFATAGGNITADGGGEITARGVCWNTTGSPTTADSLTTDDTGIGAFTSSITGLTPGQTYYMRAYAVNAGGTGYGEEISFTTLSALAVPALTTAEASNIQVTTAVSGGTITNWGGSAVTAKGICWNTTGSPTLSSSHTTDGSDIAAFTSGLTSLSANTTYYVRAYATNSTGTGYGNEISFTTLIPQADTTVIVAKDGSGDYTTVQAAFNAVPLNYSGKWTIFVKKGVYFEKDTLASGKINVVLIGEDRDSTIIQYNDYADSHGPGNPGTSGSFTITIDASDFIAKNITFQNTYSPQPGVSGTQAVALRTNGDRQEYINCKFLGFQDTYYTWGGSGTARLYHKNCYIEGTVDFIFGRNIAVFDSCTIRILRNSGTITAASTEASSKYGYVFRHCTIESDSIGFDGNPITNFYLGRPWQASPRTVYLDCYMPETLNPAGWLAWNVNPGLYAEYKTTGPGGTTVPQRVNWSSQLSDSAAMTYTLSNIFAKSSASSNLIVYDWMPLNALPEDNSLPVEISLFEGSVENNTVLLKWQTVSEKNNRGFEVERKSVKNDWHTAGYAEGKGTTSETQNYIFVDKNVSPGKYSYRLKQIDYDGTHKYSNTIEIEISVPKKFELQQNYPNPFNPKTVINFELPVQAKVTLKVYDILGKEVAVLVNEKKESGNYQVEFDAVNLASGLYIYRLSADNLVQTKKMMLVK